MALPDINTTQDIPAVDVMMANELDNIDDSLVSIFDALTDMAKVDQRIAVAVEGMLEIDKSQYDELQQERGLNLEKEREAQDSMTGDNGGLMFKGMQEMKKEASTIALILGALAAAFVAFSDNIPMWLRKLMGYQESLQENRDRVTKELEQEIEDNKDASTRLGEGQKARAERALEIMKDNPKVSGTGARAVAANEAGGFEGTGEFTEDDLYDDQTFEATKQAEAKEKIIELSKDIYYLKNVATEEEDPEAYGMNAFIADQKLEDAIDISRKNGLAMTADEIIKLGMPASAQSNITNNVTPKNTNTTEIINKFYGDEDKVMNQGKLTDPYTRTTDVTSDEAFEKEQKSFIDRFGGSEEMSEVLKKVDVKKSVSGDNEGVVIPITYKSAEQQGGAGGVTVNNVDNSSTTNVVSGGGGKSTGRAVPPSSKVSKSPGSAGSTELRDFVNE